MTQRKYYSSEAHKQVQQEKLMLALFATMCGVGIGAIIALIFAPQAGDETRSQIEDTLQNAGEDLNKRVDKMRNEVQDRVNSMVKN